MVRYREDIDSRAHQMRKIWCYFFIGEISNGVVPQKQKAFVPVDQERLVDGDKSFFYSTETAGSVALQCQWQFYDTQKEKEKTMKRMTAATMKKVTGTALAAAMTMGMLTACGGNTAASTTAATTTAGQTTAAATSAPETSAAQAAAASDTVINMAFGSGWSDLIPYNSAGGGYYSGFVLNLLYDRLFYVSADGSITPRAADSWEIAEDRLSVTFHLNQDARWSDGEPVTASDFIFAAGMITDKNCPANYRACYSLITGTDASGFRAEGEDLGVEALDDYTIRYTFKNKVVEDVIFPSYLIQILPLPEHLLADTDPADYLTQELWNAPVGSGPMIFKSTIPGSKLEVTSNPDYHLGAPNYAGINLQVISTTAMASSMLSGDIDVGYPPMSYDDLEPLRESDLMNYKNGSDAMQPFCLYINQRVYEDRRLNKALSLAIDRDAIAEMLQFGVAMETPFTASSRYLDPTVTYTYDPEAAKAIIDEMKADGALAEDQVLTICTPDGFRAQAANIMQQNFEAIGLNIEIQIEEAATMFAGFYDGSTGIGLVNTSAQVNPMYMKTQLTNDTTNYAGITTDEYDEIYDRFMEAGSDEERIEIAHELQQKWVEEEPIIFYSSIPHDYAFNKRMGDEIHLEDIMYYNVPVWTWNVQ